MSCFWKKYKEIIKLIGLAFLFALITSLLTTISLSPLYPNVNIDSINLDPNFYHYEGYLYVQGYKPYIDFYDHKGIYHVLISALGYLLGGRYALFAIDVLFTATSFFILFKAMNLMNRASLANRLVAATFFLIFASLMLRGSTEAVYLLPFITLSLYYTMKGIILKDDKSFYIGGIFMGIEVALGFNSRMSDASWGAGLAIFYIIYLLRNKKYRTLAFATLFSFLSFALCFGVFLLIAYTGGYLKEMITISFGNAFNYAFSSQDDSYSSLKLANRIGVTIVAIIGILLYIRERKISKRNQQEDPLSFFFLFNLLFACLIYFIIAQFTHYYYGGATFFILYLFHASSYFKKVNLISKKIAIGSYSTSIITILIIFMTMYYGNAFSDSVGFSYSRGQEIKEDISLISEEERREEGNLLAINLDAGIYEMAGANVSFPYFCYQSWWTKKNTVNAVEYTIDYLESEDRPGYLVVSLDETTKEDFGEVIQSYYHIFHENEITNGVFAIYEVNA